MVPVVADTDTLFGGTTRGLLIHRDYRGLIRLHWSALILDELSRALVDTGRKVDARAAQRHEQLMRDSLPHAEIDLASVNAQVTAVAAAVRSKKDAHVAACAHAIVTDKYYPQEKAVSLVTKSIRDLRVRKLAEMGVEVKRPDDFLLALFAQDALGVSAAFAALRATLRSAPMPEALLERRCCPPRRGRSQEAARYPVPCFRMGRLACRADQRGRGLGQLLVGCAVDRCLKARQQVAAYALIVDAKDDSSAAFYVHFGLKPFLDAKRTLYLPLGR